MLESGEYDSLSELTQAEKIKRYARILVTPDQAAV
jgi:hypothetical protein